MTRGQARVRGGIVSKTLLIGASVALVLSAAPAAAIISTTFGVADVGKVYNVTFAPATYIVGGSPIAIPGLQGRVVIKLSAVSANHKTWTFGYSVINNSFGETTASRISVWGFDSAVAPASTSVTGAFTIATSGNVPVLGPRNTCFKAGGGATNCAGGGSGGVTLGNTGIGTFSLVYSLAQTQATLQNLFIRFQSIDNATRALKGISADTGATDAAMVPEPASWAMLIAGFGLVGAALRRRRVVAA